MTPRGSDKPKAEQKEGVSGRGKYTVRFTVFMDCKN